MNQKSNSQSRVTVLKNLVLENLPACCVLWLLRNVLIRSEYLLKRESIQFFRFSNRAYGKRLRRKCDRSIRVALCLVDANIPNNYLSLIRKSIASTFENSGSRRVVSHSVLIATKQLKTTIFDATSWYQLSRGLFSLGYFRAAWVARENSISLSIVEANMNDASTTALKRGIQAHIEKKNYSLVHKLLLDYNKRIPAQSRSHIETTVSLIERKYRNLNAPSNLGNESSRELFSNSISGKSVALVGPSVPFADYGAEIDQFDIVIRMKFIGREMLDDQNFHGSRTDISYIGAIAAIKLQEFELQDDFRGLKLLLSNPSAVKSIGAIPVYAVGDDSEIYRTTTTSGIRTLNEVLKFSPSNLKIFGFDFYATLTPYSKQMTDFYENSSWRFGYSNEWFVRGVYHKFARARDFSMHDPVSNFCFAQNLYKAGLFDIEPYGKSILELTPYQYVERLEEMLGDW